MGDHRAVKAAAHAVKFRRHGVGLRKEGLNAFIREHVVLGSHDDVERVDVTRNEFRRQTPLVQVEQLGLRVAEADGVAFFQLPALEAADFCLHVGRAAAHYFRDVQTAGKGDVGAAAGAETCEAEGLSGVDFVCAVGLQRLAVQCGTQVSAGDGDDGGLVKLQLRPQHGAFQNRFIFGVPYQKVGETHGPGVHGAGDGDAELLVSDPAEILDRGQDARIQDGEAFLSAVLHHFASFPSGFT